MATFAWIAFFSLLTSIGIVFATALLYFRGASIVVPPPIILSFAVGTLLASAFLGLLPEALSSADHGKILATVLLGMLLFFALEKTLIWRHCHRPDCAIHSTAGPLIVIGDAFHNFVDGVVIAVAFLTSLPTGLGVSLAVIAHELPQEIGDFAILTNSGYSPRSALLLNSASASTTPVGAVAEYFLFSRMSEFVPYVLAVSAASFLYIGCADLIPSLQRETRPAHGIGQIASLLMGIAVVGFLRAGLFR